MMNGSCHRHCRWLLCLAAALLAVGCGSTRLSRKDEIRLGQRAAAQVESQYRTSEDPTVSRIGQAVAGASDAPNYPYRFRAIAMDGVNAFSLPGGPVYVTDDLLRMVAGDRDELAGVLGHEIAHITQHHAARQMERQNWLGVGIDVLTNGSAQEIATLVANLQLLHYSRDQEYQADRKGAQYARAAGFDPMGLVRFLERLADMEQHGTSIPWLRTHPGSQARADRLRQQIQGKAR